MYDEASSYRDASRSERRKGKKGGSFYQSGELDAFLSRNYTSVLNAKEERLLTSFTLKIERRHHDGIVAPRKLRAGHPPRSIFVRRKETAKATSQM